MAQRISFSRRVSKDRTAVYAEVLLKIAGGSAQALKYTTILRDFAAAVRSSIELKAVFIDSAVPAKAKQGLISTVLKTVSKSDDKLVAWLNTLIDVGEFNQLAKIIEVFESLVEQTYKVDIIDVTTALPLDSKLRQQITTKYATSNSSKVFLREKVQPEIKGGIILGKHGRVIDSSLNTQLNSLREQLLASE